MKALWDRALESHQTIVRVRLVYEDAFTRVLAHREEYESALRELEQAKRALRAAETDYETILTQLQKGASHGEESRVTEGQEEQGASGQGSRGIPG